MKDIPKLSTKELEEYLDAETTEYDHRGRAYALEEYNRRKLKEAAKTHWSTTPTFALVIISVVVAVLALLQSNGLVPKLGAGVQQELPAIQEEQAATKKRPQANNQ
jgi:hypothetical protein